VISSPDTSGQEGTADALPRLRALLQQILRITITDGRVFIGTFAGTDKPLNIILINAEEYRIGPGQNPDGRYVGQVMFPWKVVVKVEAHVREKADKKSTSNTMYI